MINPKKIVRSLPASVFFICIQANLTSCGTRSILPHQNKIAPPKSVNDIAFFHNFAPEKKLFDFKQAPAADDYFALLIDKLKKHSPIADAKNSMEAGVFYLLADSPSSSSPLHTMTIIHSRGGPHSFNKQYRHNTKYSEMAFKNCYIKRLQSFQSFVETPPASGFGQSDVENHGKYHDLARNYSMEWNNIMFPACANRTGSFIRPSNQDPKF